MRSKYLKWFLTGFAVLGFASLSISASLPGKGTKGPVRTSSARPALAQRVHDVGTIWSAISNYGNYGDPNANLPSGEWPGGSEVFYIWEGRFWLAAMVGGEPLCSHADFGNYEFDPTEGSSFYFGSGPKAIQDGWVTFDDMTDYSGHTPIGFQISQRSLAWSLTDYDDFIIFLYEIKNTSGGTLNGAMVTWVFDNDCGAGAGGDPDQPNIDDLVDYDGWTPEGQNEFRYDWVDPLDLDGDGITGYDVWGWALADPRNPYVDGYTDADAPGDEEFVAEPDGVYDEFQIYLVPGGPPIIGQPETEFDGEVLFDANGDTLRGYLLSRNMSYMYDGDYPQSGENDVGERTNTTPVAGFIGTRLLYIPMDPFYAAEDDTMPRPLSHQWWNWESDPGSDIEKYEYMTGTHDLSAGLHFMPHPFDYAAGAPVFDYRYMYTSGPYNDWLDGETKKYVMVTGVGLGIQGLRENVDNALISYFQGDPGVIGTPVSKPEEFVSDNDPTTPDIAQLGFTGVTNNAIRSDKHFLLPIPPPIPELHYSAGDRKINMVWDSSAETTIDNFLGTPDFEGYKIYRSKYNAQNWLMIAAFDNKNEPVYLLNSEGDTICPLIVGSNTLTIHDEGYWEAHAAPNRQFVKVELPDIVHGYSDEGGVFIDSNGDVVFNDTEPPINGLKYFYSVVAYDPDKPDRGLNQIESAKSNYRKSLEGAPDPVIPRPDAKIDNPDGTDFIGTVDDIKVVPNPYKGTAIFESRYEDRISFINLPPRCKISIFTMTGDLIDEIMHSSTTSGAEYWNLISRNNQKIVSGLYIYVVETPDDQKKVDKFLIIR
ncbi:MAG: hypothetical protein P9L92_00185 [Candidatus Electryonea clarkiae]|nr:hypothetical protein [Candidatus Electryonea clarkiae]